MLHNKFKTTKGRNTRQKLSKHSWMNTFVNSVSALLITLFFSVSAVHAENRDEVVFFFNDALGSAVAAVNEDGDLCWSESYTPYGDKTINDDVFIPPNSGCGIVGEERGFTGHTEDVNSDLVYMQQRYYDPSMGRFLSVDPLDAYVTDPRTYNRYAYANNNPYKYVDPDGELAVIAAIAVVSFAISLYDAHKAYEQNGFAGAAASAGTDIILNAVTGGTGKLVTKAGQMGAAAITAAKAKNKVVAKGVEKPDFIVSPNGTTMPTNKDLNLVDSNKKGGDWFQIHNKHTDAKVDGSPHTHYPKQHDRNTTREIKPTDGADLDHADNMLRNGAMRERRNRKDKGG